MGLHPPGTRGLQKTARCPPLNVCEAHRAQKHPVKQELLYPLPPLQLGPERSAAIRWRAGEKSRERTDHSSPPQSSLLDRDRAGR